MISKLRCLLYVITSSVEYQNMELINMVGWVALGFMPVFGGLEIVSRKLRTQRLRREIVLRTET